MAIKEKLQQMNLKTEPTGEDHLRARRRRDDFVAWVCNVLTGPGSKFPKQCQRSKPMGEISEWIKHFGTHNEFGASAMRRFLDGEFTDEVPIYIPKHQRKEVELILDVLDVVETMARMMDHPSQGMEPLSEPGKLPDPVVDEFLEKEPPELYPEATPVADQAKTEPPEAEKEKPVAKEPESGNTPVEGVVKPEQVGDLPDADADHDPYEKLPPEPKRLGRPPNPKEIGPPPEPKKLGRPPGSGKKKP